MITSTRLILRGMADARIHAEVLSWLNDQPRHRWHTLAQAEPELPCNIEQLMWLWNQWVVEGWLEHKIDSGRSMYRPTAQCPIVSRREQDCEQALGDLYSALLGLPTR